VQPALRHWSTHQHSRALLEALQVEEREDDVPCGNRVRFNRGNCGAALFTATADCHCNADWAQSGGKALHCCTGVEASEPCSNATTQLHQALGGESAVIRASRAPGDVVEASAALSTVVHQTAEAAVGQGRVQCHNEASPYRSSPVRQGRSKTIAVFPVTTKCARCGDEAYTLLR
jgi:hypothetical protein